MKPHEIWLYKARNDLRSAKILVERDDPVLDTSIYHTQQCAEKALKGFLVFKKHNIEKTHDVDYLIECCIDYDDEFKTLLDLGDTLSSYGTLAASSVTQNRYRFWERLRLRGARGAGDLIAPDRNIQRQKCKGIRF